jgi:hypothetical protein
MPRGFGRQYLRNRRPRLTPLLTIAASTSRHRETGGTADCRDENAAGSPANPRAIR